MADSEQPQQQEDSCMLDIKPRSRPEASVDEEIGEVKREADADREGQNRDSNDQTAPPPAFEVQPPTTQEGKDKAQERAK